MVYEDQAPVKAALNGHWLVLDGMERAERNVLPLLNNLLENREMSLDVIIYEYFDYRAGWSLFDALAAL